MLVLKDIEGLDPIINWQPWVGWLLLGSIMISLIIFLLIRLYRWFWLNKLTEYWRRDAYQQLKLLKQKVKQQGDSPELILEFSILLRRIVMALHGREHCAGLTDKAWLSFLQAHDPCAFDWLAYEHILLYLPYQAPAKKKAKSNHLLKLVKATMPWLYKELQHV